MRLKPVEYFDKNENTFIHDNVSLFDLEYVCLSVCEHVCVRTLFACACVVCKCARVCVLADIK